MKEAALFILGFLVFLALTIGGIIFLVNWSSSVECASKAALMNKPHQYGPLLGCMVQIDGEFVPLSAYKVIR